MNPEIDVLSQVAEVLRLRGSLGFVLSPATPWGVAVPKSHQAKLLVVTRGHLHFEMEGVLAGTLELAPGDVIGIPHGTSFAIRDDPGSPLNACVHGPVVQAPDAPRGSTEFVGLSCELAGGDNNPLLRVLPPFIHGEGSDSSVARWLEPTIRLIAAESRNASPGRTTILDRLAEVAFIQLIRAWLERLPDGEGGWLRALGDRQIAPAIQAIHGEPGTAWTVASLATRAGMSRSAFAARFKVVVGESPLEYLTRWRLQRATNLLETRDVPLKEIVSTSGYASEAAFRTVFKKWMGESPGGYRARKRVGRGAEPADSGV